VRVGLFVPCFIDTLEPAVAIASVKLLEHLGVEVDYPRQQTCCGQPHYNAGLHSQAAPLARRFVELFEQYETVVTPSGSCAAMVRNHYPELIGHHPVCDRVFELCELLVEHMGISRLGARFPGTAALHIGCHALRELGLGAAARQLIDHVEGLKVVELESDEWCCGFGGTFSVKFPEVSTAMAMRKLEPILERDVDYLISTDTSCLMQLGGYLRKQGLERPRPVHVAEVLATCAAEEERP